MAIKKTVEIDVDVIKANGGLESFKNNFIKAEEAAKSLRTQMREAQQEVALLSEKFGATSREAVEAAKKAAILKDKIGDAKTLTDAFNPDAKFKALSGSLVGVAGGFSVVTGLMGTLGTESKGTTDALLKVQSAMAIASGAQAIGESIDQFKQLGAVVKSYSLVQKISTAAQWLWNAAMAANPIGAIVVAITALIAAGYALVSMFKASNDAAEKSAAANKSLTKELENYTKATKLANDESQLQRDNQLAVAKAKGESTKAIRTLSIELANQLIAEKKLNAETAQSIYFSALKNEQADEDSEVAKENTKKAKELLDKATQDYSTAILDRKKLRLTNQVQEIQEQTDANKKTVEDAKKHHDELLSALKKANEERIAEFLRLKRAETDILNQAALDREKADTDFFNAEMEARKNNELAKITEKEADLERLRLKYEAQLEYAKKNNLDASGLEDEKANAINDINLKYQQLSYENQEKFTENQKTIAAEVAKNKEEQLRDNLENANAILSLGGAKFAKVQKALAIAEIIRDTIRAVNAATGNEIKVPAFVGVIPNPIKPASVISTVLGITGAIAKGAASIAAINSNSTSAPSSGGGAGGGASGGGAPAPPQFNIVGQSSTNQLSATIAGQQNRPIQTYVVGNQITNQQALDRNAAQTSSFG